MPGRNDFAIIRARLLADDRAHKAADLYVKAGIAAAPTALAAVVGHIAELGLWASRETDDGILPDDGIGVVSVATMSPRDVARVIVRSLTRANLLRPVESGVYVCGFAECYSVLFNKRNRDRANAAKARAAKALRASRRRRSDVAPTSERCRSGVETESDCTAAAAAAAAVQSSTDPPPLVAPAGGSPSAPSANGPPAGTPERAESPPASRPPDERPLTLAEREGALAACGAILGERDVAPDVRQRARNVDKLVRSGIVPAEAVREFVRSTVMSRTGARVAYIAAMKGVAS